MPTITEIGNPSNSLTTPGWTLADEFLPLIKFHNPSKYNVRDEKLTPSGDTIKLSEYLDESKQNLEFLQLTTEKNKISLPFQILKGSDDSDDEDGIVTVKLSVNDPKIKLTSKGKFKSSYGSKYSLELEMNSEKSTEFFIDFYAKDDTDDEYNKGELFDIHCGRIKIVFNIKTICSDWPTIPTVIPVEKFIGWRHQGITKNCYHYCLEQLRVSGHWVKTERWNKKWDGTKELNDDIYQIFLEDGVAGMKKGVQKKELNI